MGKCYGEPKRARNRKRWIQTRGYYGNPPFLEPTIGKITFVGSVTEKEDRVLNCQGYPIKRLYVKAIPAWKLVKYALFAIFNHFQSRLRLLKGIGSQPDSRPNRKPLCFSKGENWAFAESECGNGLEKRRKIFPPHKKAIWLVDKIPIKCGNFMSKFNLAWNLLAVI
jgi:hypothetical protein